MEVEEGDHSTPDPDWLGYGVTAMHRARSFPWTGVHRRGLHHPFPSWKPTGVSVSSGEPSRTGIVFSSSLFEQDADGVRELQFAAVPPAVSSFQFPVSPFAVRHAWAPQIGPVAASFRDRSWRTGTVRQAMTIAFAVS